MFHVPDTESRRDPTGLAIRAGVETAHPCTLEQAGTQSPLSGEPAGLSTGLAGDS